MFCVLLRTLCNVGTCTSQIDENGCGDAYVGGFLHGLTSGWSLNHSLAAAAYCAWVVIQRHGCTLPDKLPLKSHAGFSFGSQ